MVDLFTLQPGSDLAGDYRIRGVLGAGGFGVTYRAEELALARDVAIKEYCPAGILRPVVGGSVPASMPPGARRALLAEGLMKPSWPWREVVQEYNWGLDRFFEEARTLAHFLHPNIVRIQRYLRANNTAYMVMQLEEGTNLEAWVKGLRRAPRQAELDHIVEPLLDALELVHSSNYLHRDIAPDNILIRKDGSPVLIDFGSARGEVALHTRTVSAFVKMGYSPYEQYATTTRGQGPWTDIYALGATLYRVLAGVRPPDAPSRLINDEYIPAREVALSSYRSSFLAAIDRALRLEVGERPQSIAQWREMLLLKDAPKSSGHLSQRELERLRLLAGPFAGGEPSAAPLASERKAAVIATAPAAPVADAPLAAASERHKVLEFLDAWKRRRQGFRGKQKPDG